MDGDSRSAKRVRAGPTSSTSFSKKAEPPALPRWGDVLVDKGTAAPKPCLPPMEMRTLTVAGGLLPTGKASTATGIIYYQPRLCFCPIKEINSRTSNRNATDYISFWKLKILRTKSRKTLMFDPGDSTGCQRACPVLRT